MKTAIVKQVRENAKKSYVGRNGNVFVHGITIEGDPQEYEYHSLQETCTKFVPTQEATFTTEVKVNGAYTNYKISPVAPLKPAGGGFSGGAKKDYGKDQEVISALSSVSTAANFYSNRGVAIGEDKLLELAEKIYNWATSKSKK